MKQKYTKFTAVNVCVLLILLLFALLPDYTVRGLTVFIAGAAVLFLGTFLDNAKTTYGVFNKLSYIIFITVLILFGIYMPDTLPDKINVSGAEDPLQWVFSLIAVIVLFIVSRVISGKIYVLKKIFKYASMTFLFYFIYNVVGIPENTFRVVIFCSAAFMMMDIYSINGALDKPTTIELNKDKSFWMAATINLLIVAANIIFPGWLISKLGSDEHVYELAKSMTSGYNVPLFVLFMIVLTGIFMYVDDIRKSQNSIDSYLSLSLGGFAVVFATYLSHRSLETFIALAITVILYMSFGHSVIYMGKKSPLNALLKKGVFAPAIVSVSITLISVVSIIYGYEGYFLPLIVLICGILLILVSKKIFKSNWVLNTVRWQMILFAILIFAVSISVVNDNLDSTITVLISTFIVSSFATWAFGIRDGVWDNRYIISKTIVCVITGIVSLVAAI